MNATSNGDAANRNHPSCKMRIIALALTWTLNVAYTFSLLSMLNAQQALNVVSFAFLRRLLTGTSPTSGVGFQFASETGLAETLAAVRVEHA